MTRRTILVAIVALPFVAAACRAERGTPASAPPAAPSALGSSASAAPRWSANPANGARVTAAGDSLQVTTGLHTILWQAPARELAPPYTVRATFQKHHGRLHEGYGLIFGGTGLEGPEAGQAYGYFLVRGDGSFLVKRRQGAETPVIQDWTGQAVIHRDLGEAGQPNELEVRVTAADVAFLVNGTEVARVPAAELPVRGVAGVRIPHEVAVVVRGFRAEPGVGQ